MAQWWSVYNDVENRPTTALLIIIFNISWSICLILMGFWICCGNQFGNLRRRFSLFIDHDHWINKIIRLFYYTNERVAAFFVFFKYYFVILDAFPVKLSMTLGVFFSRLDHLHSQHIYCWLILLLHCLCLESHSYHPSHASLPLCFPCSPPSMHYSQPH